MKRNMMRRNLHRSIKRSIGRYIAIVAIIALGAGMFVGLRTTKSDMIATGQRYMDQQNMFDLRLLSTYGWEREDVARVAQIEGVEDAEGVISMDAIVYLEDAQAEFVYKLYSIPETINKVYLHGGRMPESPNECLADGFYATDDILGKEVTISTTNSQDTLDSLTEHTFTVVGYVASPLYMDLSRGNTSVGNGTVSAFLYIPEEAFTVDYYTEIAVTLPGDSTVYSDSYQDLVTSEADRLTPLLLDVADERYRRILSEAENAYADGLSQYEDGLSEYQEAKAEADAQLAEAKEQLTDAEKEISENRKKLTEGLAQLEEGQAQIDSGRITLANGRLTLAKTKADTYAQLAEASTELMKNYKQVNDGIDQINDGITQIDSAISLIDSGVSQLQSGLQQLETLIGVTQTLLNLADSALDRAENALTSAEANGVDGELLAQLSASVEDARAQIQEYETQLSEMKAQQQTYSKQLLELQAQRQSLVEQRAQLEESKKPLEDANAQIEQGLAELESARSQAENGFAAAEAELEAAALELDLAQIELDNGKKELETGLAQLEQGQEELDASWAAYNLNAQKVGRELSNAWKALEDAKIELAQGKETIDSMDQPDVYALGRNTNMGYLSLDSNSDIVQGVSTVFPAFFLLIAALVCITTMTRMVEEERTQIGTLKALGYSSRSIIGKYLAYAGSAAVLGCGLGVVAGSVVFPLILWEVYQILMFMGDYFLLQIDWSLCLLVVGVYTAITLLVTWYCCRRSLREVPAELIRPKPPTTGKSIFLEKVPFWNRISFLNKVMLRNVFRYRQRLLMMLVGIGGCTALLLTGFGIRDSIGDLADYQFDEVFLYDLEVRFDHSMLKEDQENFLQALDGKAEDVLFFHQSNMELVYQDQLGDVNFIVTEQEMERFIDFHNGDSSISMPGQGEAIISIGIAERLGIKKGDKITVRDQDMQALLLEVIGIFDNNVYNYVITTPETVQRQWGSALDVQMACIYTADGTDVREVGSHISNADSVMSVTVNQDVREQVGKMLEALDLVVITVVVCAALLAIIVLYNLTNINITERLREIATIKVLGFRAGETAAYVFKENLLLSVMGAALGLVGGIFLLDFVMSQIQVDMVWMTSRLMPMSFVWSVLLTMLSACLVDFVLYFKLGKINMAEALKSVE